MQIAPQADVPKAQCLRLARIESECLGEAPRLRRTKLVFLY